MLNLSFLTVRHQFVLLMMVIASVLIIGYSVFAYQIEKLKHAKESIEEMTVISRALNHDYAELTTMGLPTSSMEVIRKWKAWPMIEHADLNDKNGRPILHYSKFNTSHELINIPQAQPHAVVDGLLLFKHDVKFGGKTIGVVSYAVSNQQYEQLINELYKQLVIVIPIALGLSVLLFLWLQHIFVYPLQSLMTNIKLIGEKQDYSARILVADEDKSEFAIFRKEF